MNKALVSLGQRPMIAHHLELMRRAGVSDVVIVTSPSSASQVSAVVDRSHAGMNMRVSLAVQETAAGPADAVRVGAGSFGPDRTGPVYIIMADTFIDEGFPAIGETGAWVGVAPATSTRSWCYPDCEDGDYTEGVVPAGSIVCIGVYGFSDVHRLHDTATQVCKELETEPEAPMAPLLNEYGDIDCNEVFKSWLDVGDVRALARARRQRFITREFNHLELTDQGVLVKHGDNGKLDPEIAYYEHLFPDAQLLFPRYLGRTHDNGYMMEFVDLPSLAELYLYWPGRPDMWANVIEDVISRISRDLWVEDKYSFGESDESVNWHNEMYVYKVNDRLKAWEDKGNTVLWWVVEKLQEFLAMNTPKVMVRGHGDLNFGNILYSLGSDVMKLVDPRGDTYVDRDYEFAKLRYSYRDGFSAICHNLFEMDGGMVRLGPDREAESQAIDRVLSNLSDLRRITAVEATIFLSAAPLHVAEQGKALYAQGVKLAQEAIDGQRWSTAKQAP